ncbi:MAG: Spy/CpxP family protein refolding chaperone [Gammaproteobacteria bacterium]|nr:Spy/CpxP family protein refolding chaperone [Gammaproteobacteria bacterium]
MIRISGKLLTAVLLAGALGAAIPAAYSNEGWGQGRCYKERGAKGDHAARFEDRQILLHAKLKLTPEQEPAWNTFAGKVKPVAADERPERPDPEELAKLTAPERMEAMLAGMKAREERMTSHLAAVKEFYAVLTPEQQKVFDTEFGRGMRGYAQRMHRD